MRAVQEGQVDIIDAQDAKISRLTRLLNDVVNEDAYYGRPKVLTIEAIKVELSKKD